MEKASNLATGCKLENAAEQKQAVASAFVACSFSFISDLFISWRTTVLNIGLDLFLFLFAAVLPLQTALGINQTSQTSDSPCCEEVSTTDSTNCSLELSPCFY